MLRNLFFVATGMFLAHAWATIDQDTLDAIIGIAFGCTLAAILLTILFYSQMGDPQPQSALSPAPHVLPKSAQRKPTRTLPRSVPVYLHNPNYVDFDQIARAMHNVIPSQSIMGLSTKRMATA